MVPHPRYLIDIGDMAPERAAPLACSGVTTYGALKKVGPTLDNCYCVQSDAIQPLDQGARSLAGTDALVVVTVGQDQNQSPQQTP